MASNSLSNIRVALKCDTSEKWAASNLVLLKGELGIEFFDDADPKVKIGDGQKLFKDLPYITMSDKEIMQIVSSQLNTETIKLVEGNADGKIGLKVGNSDPVYISVKGLGGAAFQEIGAFATAAQGKKADEALPLSGGTLTGGLTLSADPVNLLDAATKQYVDTVVSTGIVAASAVIYKGTIGENGTESNLPTTYNTGWLYVIATAGTYGGQVCEVGDLAIALKTRNGEGNLDSDWTFVERNIDGAITQAGAGLEKDGMTVKHSNVIEAGTAKGGEGAVGFGGAISIPSVSYDSTGHVTGTSTTSVTLPSTVSTDILRGGENTLVLSCGNSES